MTYRALIEILRDDDWYVSRRGKGSHVVYRHASKPGIIVIAPHALGQDVPPGTLQAILRQAGLKR